MTWTRTAIPAAGRSLCDRPGHSDRRVVIARRYGYDVTTSAGTVRVRDFSTGVLGWHVEHPTEDDLAWLRGGA